MSEWPPRFEDNFIIRETGVPPYYRKIQSELQRKVKQFSTLSAREQFDLKLALYMIDMTASFAARELRDSPWTTSQLFSMTPPSGANPIADAKQRRKYDRWLRDREHQFCLRFCRRGRRALLIGEWGKAIYAAIYAGQHSNGALALKAQQSLQGLRGGSLANQRRAAENREIIFREAEELCTEHKKAHKKYNVSSIASKIADKHKDDTSFPDADAIRHILGKDKRWKSRA